jgi:hypothetical protein
MRQPERRFNNMPDQNIAAIPPPPPGFVPMNSAPSPSSSPSIPPPPAGFVSADSTSGGQAPDPQLAQDRAANDARPWWRKALGLPAASTPEDQAKDAAFWAEQKTRMEGALKDNFQARADVPIGATKAAGRSVVGATNLAIRGYDKVTGSSKTHEIEPPQSLQSDGSFGQTAGAMYENVLEFLSGDAALKALSVSEKFKLGAKLATLAEESPSVAKLIHAGLNSIRTGVVSGAQEAVHGGDTGDVLTAAGTGALSSAASEGLGVLSKLAKPGSTEISNETLQTSPKWKGASTSAKLAEANQQPAQKVVSNVAQSSADNIMQRFSKSAPDTITSFGDAAEAVKSAAQPVFKTLDTVSNGQFAVARNEMGNAAKFMKRAASSSDYAEAEKSYNTASAKIDQIITDSKGAVTPEQYQSAKDAWRSAKTMEKLHLKIDEAYSSGQKAENIAGVDRTLDLNKLQGRLNSAFKTIPEADLKNVLGAEGTKNLFDLAKLGADPVRSKTLGEIASQIGHHISAGGAGALAGLALGHALPAGALALGAHALYTNPEAGSLVVRLLQKGSTPKVIVPAVIKLLDSQREQNQGTE